MGVRSKNRLPERFRVLSGIFSIIVLLGGALVIVGWALEIGFLKSILPGLVEMKVNTALGFILSGLSLWLLQEKRLADKKQNLAARGCAWVVFFIGALTLFEYAWGWDLGIDQFFFAERADAILTASPGRMALNTAFCFMLLGGAFALFDKEFSRRKSCFCQEVLVLVVIITAFLVLVGYLYDSRTFYFGVTRYTAMALHTTIFFILLGLAALFSRPERGFMRVLTNEEQAGRLARLLLFGAFVAVFGIDIIGKAGEQAGWYDRAAASALHVILTFFFFAVLIVSVATSLFWEDWKRKEAEKELMNKLYDLEIFQKIAVDRELKMVELKERISRLEGMLKKTNA